VNGVALSSNRAVDGNFNTSVIVGCSSASDSTRAWLAVDLGTMVHVKWIQLTNPTGTDGKGSAKRMNMPTSDCIKRNSQTYGLCRCFNFIESIAQCFNDTSNTTGLKIR
jgi:hypothetical protein